MSVSVILTRRLGAALPSSSLASIVSITPSSRSYLNAACSCWTSDRFFSTAPAPSTGSSSSSSPPSSSSSSFFGYTSGRARRRRKRLLRYQQLQRKNGKPSRASNSNAQQQQPREFDEDDVEDTRTVKDILWPNPFKDEPPLEEPVQWPKTYEGWRLVLSKAWSDYKYTWRGFTTSKGLFVEDPEDAAQAQKEREKAVNEIRDRAEELQENAKRNAEFLKDEAFNLRQEVQERTGIHNKEDLRKWAAEMMRLASDCVNQFMQGYRKGRDDEVEKMLTQYFDELEKEANQPRKRRKKRRVLNRRHPMAR